MYYILQTAGTTLYYTFEGISTWYVLHCRRIMYYGYLYHSQI